MFMRSLTIKQQLVGPEHPDVATLLNNIAELMRHTGRSASSSREHANLQTNCTQS